MIRLSGLTARSASLQLAPLTLTLQAAVHAMLGGPEDAVSLLLSVLAGEVRPRAGAVQILGGPPGAARASIAYVPLDVVLPEVLTAAEVLDLAAEVRGEPRGFAKHRLGALGVAPLADRPARSLTPQEARAVAMAEALTSRARILLIEEPLVGLDPRAVGPLTTKLRERAYDGACIVVSTASTRDATELADIMYLFDRGVLSRILRANDPQARATAHGTRVRVRASDARALLAALASEPEVLEIATDKGVLVLTGGSELAIAEAVARAALAAGVELLLLAPEAAAMEELRATTAGEAAGAYQAALARAKATAATAGNP